jgi:hypothetical protein
MNELRFKRRLYYESLSAIQLPARESGMTRRNHSDPLILTTLLALGLSSTRSVSSVSLTGQMDRRAIYGSIVRSDAVEIVGSRPLA